MPKALRDVKISFFFAYSSCYYFNLIAFIISIETKDLLLALAKSVYWKVPVLSLQTAKSKEQLLTLPTLEAYD